MGVRCPHQIASSAAGLLGAILTDARARRLREAPEGSHPWARWLLGVMALLPAWIIAMIGLGMGRSVSERVDTSLCDERRPRRTDRDLMRRGATAGGF
jgi:hypothetical protein